MSPSVSVWLGDVTTVRRRGRGRLSVLVESPGTRPAVGRTGSVTRVSGDKNSGWFSIFEAFHKFK